MILLVQVNVAHTFTYVPWQTAWIVHPRPHEVHHADFIMRLMKYIQLFKLHIIDDIIYKNIYQQVVLLKL